METSKSETRIREILKMDQKFFNTDQNICNTDQKFFFFNLLSDIQKLPDTHQFLELFETKTTPHRGKFRGLWFGRKFKYKKHKFWIFWSVLFSFWSVLYFFWSVFENFWSELSKTNSKLSFLTFATTTKTNLTFF